VKSSIAEDLEEIWKRTRFELESLSGKTLLLTGSTGMFGVWILYLLLYAKEHGISTRKLLVLSRDPVRFINKYPTLCSDLEIDWITGDIRSFHYSGEKIDICIHGATTSAQETFLGTSNYEKYLTVTQGTQRILDLAQKFDVESLLYLSSGAIFGGDVDSPGLNLEESYIPKIYHLDDRFTLGQAKRSAETLCFLARAQNPHRLINIARLFTFVGPYMPFDVHYAIGNFLGSAQTGGPIRLRTAGAAVRSFMYMADAVIWIFKSLMLNMNSPFPLHIGSEKAISIKDTAQLIATKAKCDVIIEPQDSDTPSPAPNFYVPSTQKTRELLRVEEWTNLSSSIEKTLGWLPKG
jgi:UDP-glucuronate decarboxylase